MMLHQVLLDQLEEGFKGHWGIEGNPYIPKWDVYLDGDDLKPEDEILWSNTYDLFQNQVYYIMITIVH